MSYQVLDAGEGGRMTGTLKDAAGVVIPKTSVSTITLTLTDAGSGSVVNSRNAQNALDANGCTLDATSGAFAWTIAAADTTLVDATADAEEHTADFTVAGTFTGSPLKFRHRIRCMGTLLLCRFDDVALYLKDIDTNLEESLVVLLIEAFTKRVEAMTRRTLRKSTAASPTVDVFSPPPDRGENRGYSSWYSVRATRWPIDSVVSIKEDLNGDFASADALDSTDYGLGPEGIIRMRWRPFLSGTACLQVKTVGGLARDTGAVPADLRNAAARQVAYWWQRRTDLGISGMNAQGGSISLYATGDLLPDVEETVKRYRPKVI